MKRPRKTFPRPRVLPVALFLSAFSAAAAQQSPPAEVFSVTLPLSGSASPSVAIAADAAGDGYVLSQVTAYSPFSVSIQTTKLSPGGDVVWSKNFQGVDGDVLDAAGIAVDAEGNSYVAMTDFSALSSFVVKRDADGLFVSSQTLPLPGSMKPVYSGSGMFLLAGGIAFDPSSGHLYAASTYNDPAHGYADAFVVEYSTGLVQLSTQTAAQAEVTGISTDKAGNVYVGADQQTIKFAPHLAGPPLYRTQFTGDFSFPRGFFSDLAVDPSGDSWAAGYIGGSPNPYSSTNSGFLVQLDANGSFKGTASFQTPPDNDTEQINDAFFGEAADAGGAYAADFGSVYSYGTNPPFYRTLVQLVKYDAQRRRAWIATPFVGLQVFAAPFGGQQVQPAFGNGVAVDAQGDVYATATVWPMPAETGQTVVAKYHQASNRKLKIVLSSTSVAPAPPTYPGVQLSGNPSAEVEIDLLDAAGAPVAQQASVDVGVTEVALSGGHAHDDARPVGTLSGQGIAASSAVVASTDQNGRLFLVYDSTSVGGQETITASLADDAGASTSAVVSVAVADSQGAALLDLSTFPIAPFADLTGNTLPTTYAGCPGYSTQNHPSNHWATGDTLARALTAIVEFYNETGIRLGINDMSLESGGLFDICGDWQLTTYFGRYGPTLKGHKCHRGGNSIDIDISNLTPGQVDALTSLMGQFGGKRVREGPLHYQFPGLETCFGTGGQ